MLSRLQLHEELCTMLGSRHVYFQPPESVKLVYPAIVYQRVNIDNTPADNDIYKQDTQYRLTYITYNPDDPLVEKLSRYRHAKHTAHFASDQLNHDIFTIYNT